MGATRNWRIQCWRSAFEAVNAADPSLNSLILFLCQVAAGEPSSLSTTTGPCSFGDAGRADPPSETSPAPPDRAYEATAWRQTVWTQRVRRLTDKTLE